MTRALAIRRVLHPEGGAGSCRGFTLVELMIAITLMAVLAVLGWRGLDTVLRSRDRITEASDQLRALTLAFAQLDDDLRRAWPVRLRGLAQPPILLSSAPDGTQALVLLREMPPEPGAPPLQRVIYRLRGDLLERGFAPWVAPVADDAPATPAPEPVWQPLVAGVAGWRLRVWRVGSGWVDAGASGEGGITGVEVTLARVSGDRLLRLFTVKD